MFDWNQERRKTRNRLLEYGYGIPAPIPITTEESLESLSHKLYLIAKNNGFTEAEEDFIKLFSGTMNNKQVLFASFSTFPQMGDQNVLYFDIDEKILYYWNNEYIPVNAMLIANTTLEGGGA